MKIAIDFDGTIVENKYPHIGEEMMFAFSTLKALKKKGHQLLLWTFRHGPELQQAVEFCKQNGVEFDGVNQSYHGEVFNPVNMSRKLDVDCFIDDRNVGGFLGWGRIYQLLHPEDNKRTKEILLDFDAHTNYAKHKTLKKRVLYSLTKNPGLD
jgi:hypothetical protein